MEGGGKGRGRRNCCPSVVAAKMSWTDLAAELPFSNFVGLHWKHFFGHNMRPEASVFWSEMKPTPPPQWKRGILTTGPPGKSVLQACLVCNNFLYSLVTVLLFIFAWTYLSSIFFKNTFIFYLFGCSGLGGLSFSTWDLQLQHVGSSFLTWDWARAPCIGSTESQPLGHREVPIISIFEHIFWVSVSALGKEVAWVT